MRTLHRAGRAKASVPTVSLVGYTNAGKSTLLNTLTNSDIYAQDQLFATLDPTTRQLDLPNKQQAILTDTVGFIQRLPHQLVAAFQSTLEEVVQSDVLLHVIDVSHELYKEQAAAVYQVLDENTEPYTGTGTEDDPYVFLCSSAKGYVVAKGSFLNKMAAFQADGTKEPGREGYWYQLEFHQNDTITNLLDRKESCTGYYLVDGGLLEKW